LKHHTYVACGFAVLAGDADDVLKLTTLLRGPTYVACGFAVLGEEADDVLKLATMFERYYLR
jgi:hypothetical protein